jgi:hypothetical protein
VTPPYLSLLASVQRRTPAPEELAPEVREVMGADGTSLGAVSVKVDGAIPRPGDDAGGLFWDWVMHGAGIGAPGSARPR